MPADVQILMKNLTNARSLAVVGKTVYICHYGECVSVYPTDIGKLSMKGMLKDDLIDTLEKFGLQTNGLVPALKERIQDHLEHLQEEFMEQCSPEC